MWVGVLVGTVEAGETLEGEYTNPNESDPFDTRWTPSARGDYVLRFTVDPEHANAETDESNNVVEVYLSVRKAKRGDPQVLDLVRRDNSDSRDASDDDGQRGNTPREEEQEREEERREWAERSDHEEDREREDDLERGKFSQQIRFHGLPVALLDNLGTGESFRDSLSENFATLASNLAAHVVDLTDEPLSEQVDDFFNWLI